MIENCHTLAPDGTLDVGINLVQQDKKGSFIRFGDEVQNCTIPFFASKAYGAPRVNEQGLVEAAPSLRETSKGFTGRGEWPGALLFVNTRGLEFSTHASRYFDIRGARPGVDTVEHPFAQVGAHNEGRRLQLLVVAHGSGVFICDHHNRYIHLVCRHGQLLPSAAGSEGYAGFLVQRAERNAQTHEALVWTRAALTSLGKRHYWPQLLETRLEQLENAPR